MPTGSEHVVGQHNASLYSPRLYIERGTLDSHSGALFTGLLGPPRTKPASFSIMCMHININNIMLCKHNKARICS